MYLIILSQSLKMAHSSVLLNCLFNNVVLD